MVSCGSYLKERINDDAKANLPIDEVLLSFSPPRPIYLRAEMKFSGVFPLMLLSVLCSGAKRPSAGTFEHYHAKSQSSAPLRLDDSLYDELTATPRNHSVVVLLTALEARFGCQLCRDFQPEWDLLGKSWAKGDKYGDSRILLGTLDFADGKGIFQKVLLENCVSVRSGWIWLTAIHSAYASNSSHFPFVSTDNWSKCQARRAAHSI